MEKNTQNQIETGIVYLRQIYIYIYLFIYLYTGTYQLWSEFLISPLITFIILPYIIPYILPLKSLDYSTYGLQYTPTGTKVILRWVRHGFLVRISCRTPTKDITLESPGKP